MADLTVGLVIVTGPRKILVVSPGAIFSPEEARDMAATLNKAADESERSSPIILPKGVLAG